MANRVFVLSDHDTLFGNISNLAAELASLIIDQCVGQPTLTTKILEDGTHHLIRPRYKPELKPSDLPEHFEAEHKRLLRKKWLRSEKAFINATDFVRIHLACLMHHGAFEIIPTLHNYIMQPIILPPFMQPCSALNLTGLENIELALPIDEFFSIFKVAVPPFPSPDHRYYDDTLIGAGTYLAHTRSLSLVFKATSPWFDLLSGPWTEEDDNGMSPRIRPNVCYAGLIVDWILTYAWHHEYLQHIQRIKLKGDIQDWVKEKWSKVFVGIYPEQDTIASRRHIDEVEHHGQRDMVAVGGVWLPTEHYPPTCHCKINCGRLRDGIVYPEIPFIDEKWDPYTEEDSSPAELQPWFNRTDCDW